MRRIAAVFVVFLLGACSLAKTVENQTPLQRLQTACAVYNAVKVGAGIALGTVPGGGSAATVIAATVDPVCADPEKFVDTAEKTAQWVLQNADGLKKALVSKK
jgi:hypothetical protein